jgi:hypothetical protein
MQGHGTCCPRKQDGENKDALLLRQPLTNAHLIPSANRPASRSLRAIVRQVRGAVKQISADRNDGASHCR